MPKKPNSNNFWNAERNERLTEIFNKGQPKDQVIAEQLNEEWKGCTFSSHLILQQRLAMGLVRRKLGNGRRSSKTLPPKKIFEDIASDNVQYLTKFKNGGKVYVPAVGVCEYRGKEVIPPPSVAAGLEFHVFVPADSKSKIIKIPPAQVGNYSIRAMMSPEQAGNVMAILKSPVKNMGAWIHAKTVFNDKMKSPNYQAIAEIIRDTLGKKVDDAGLAFSYSDLARQALGLLAPEYAHVRKIPLIEAYNILEKAAMEPKSKKEAEPAPSAA